MGGHLNKTDCATSVFESHSTDCHRRELKKSHCQFFQLVNKVVSVPLNLSSTRLIGHLFLPTARRQTHSRRREIRLFSRALLFRRTKNTRLFDGFGHTKHFEGRMLGSFGAECITQNVLQRVGRRAREYAADTLHDRVMIEFDASDGPTCPALFPCGGCFKNKRVQFD